MRRRALTTPSDGGIVPPSGIQVVERDRESQAHPKHSKAATIGRRGGVFGAGILGRGCCANHAADVGSIVIEPTLNNIGVSLHRVRGGSMDMFGKTAAA